MNSMTGFGRSTRIADGLQCTIEIKSVNSRFLDLNIRSPKQVNSVEHSIRKCIQKSLHRGKVDVFVTLQDIDDREKQFLINSSLKNQIQDLLVLEGFYKSAQEVPLAAVMSISNEWIQIKDDEIQEDSLCSLITETTMEALNALVHMRTSEGVQIQQDLLERLSHMTAIIDDINAHKEDAVLAYKENLRKKMLEYVDNLDIAINEDRLLQEVAIMADKTDITEEIVRFRSHVVQLKCELEKVREQVQNIE